MSNVDDNTMKQPTGPTAPPVADVENQTNPATTSTGFGVPAIVRRWKREDLIKRGSLALRGLALLFSLLAFIIMASNKHGDWKNFDRYEEFRYVLAIAILSTLYTAVQALRHVHELSTGKHLIQQRTSAMVDFFGDQIMAYLLISAASSAVPMTNRMREGADNIFTDALAAAISMAFLAFLSLGLSAMISGYKLSTQSYI
uniref:CASP-like protein n=1 Tax=Fagus sylvatica TaxID=28930 RepID=A0A2N9G091_FAGSY